MSRRRGPTRGSGDPRRRITTSDPAQLGGTMAGPGGSRNRNSVVLDTSNAILMDRCAVAFVDKPTRGGQPTPPVGALTIGGKVNQRPLQAEILTLIDADGAAALVAELCAFGRRLDVHHGDDEFLRAIRGRLAQFGADGGLDDDVLPPWLQQQAGAGEEG